MDSSQEKDFHGKFHHSHHSELKIESEPSTSRKTIIRKRGLLASSKSQSEHKGSETNESNEDESVENESENSIIEAEQKRKDIEGNSSDDQLLSDSSLPPKKKKKWLKSRAPLLCPDCGHVTSSKAALRSHVQRVHSVKSNSFEDNSKTHQVHDIDKYKTSSHVSNESRKTMPCSFKEGPQNLNSKKNIEKHLLTHADEQSYHCTNCNREFQHVNRLDCDEIQPGKGNTIHCSYCHFEYQNKNQVVTVVTENLNVTNTTSTESKSREPTMEPESLSELNMHQVFEKSVTYYLDHNGT